MKLAHALALGLSLAVGASCGVTAGNPGGGGKTRYEVEGLVSTVETMHYGGAPVQLYDLHGNMVTYTSTTTDGTYRLDNIAKGGYTIQIGKVYRQPLNVIEDTVASFILPLPAGPTGLRFIDMGPRHFCLQWADRSGLEAGFVLLGPQAHGAPANRLGVAEHFANYPADYGELAPRWNERYAGTYYLWAYNEYGESASTAVDVPAYAADRWSFATPPSNPEFSDDPHVRACMGAIGEEGQGFLEP